MDTELRDYQIEVVNAALDMERMKDAYRHASKHSTDPSTSNGAVLVTPTGVIVKAANYFASGVKESPERWERPLKYSFVEHAERNVIYKAAKYGIATIGSTLYCPWFACADCGRAIIQAGIVEVVGHDNPLHKTHPNWRDSIKVALEMFDEAGIKYRYVSGDMGGISIRFNGKVVEV